MASAKPKKQLGQNFLVNAGVCEKIADACVLGKTGVIEIGPGLGALTKKLAERAEKVVAIELDRDLIAPLKENLRDHSNVEIINADALEVDMAALIRERFSGDVVIAGNLPYYITSPIIMSLLEKRLPAKSIVAMVQKEAAERLCAKDGSRECGAATYAVRYYSEPKILFDVSPGSFYPVPKVKSSVMRLDILEHPRCNPKDERLMFSLIKAAFSQRRKTAANAIAAGLGTDKAAVISALAAVGEEESVRPERLTLERFALLSDALL